MSYVAQKLPVMLKRLLIEYQRKGFELEQRMLRECRYLVHENTAVDGYNGGVDGHDIAFFYPEEVFHQIGLDDEEAARTALSHNLAKMIPGAAAEFINEVRFELAEDGDPDYQRAIPFSNRPAVDPAALPYWRDGQVRLFISHKDDQKEGAKELAEALEGYGVSSFVAHDTIKPLKEWRHEIIKGLETMEIMLIYLTDGLEASYWCQQEVGYALGKATPIISLKLEKKDPPGFISHVQAARGSLADPAASAPKIYDLIAEALHSPERLQDGLVSAFVRSENYDQARAKFDRMNKTIVVLSEKQLASIVDGYRENESLWKAIYLDNKYNRLVNFLSRVTGKQFVIEVRDIKVVDELDDDVPF